MFTGYSSTISDSQDRVIILDLFHITDTEDSHNFGKCLFLTYKQRLWSFGITSLIGTLLMIAGITMLFVMDSLSFSITYAIGNICMILATFFLFGPKKQYKNMSSSFCLAISVIIYFLMFILVFVLAYIFVFGIDVVLCTVYLIIQLAAYFWYTISSIPGIDTYIKCCKN